MQARTCTHARAHTHTAAPHKHRGSLRRSCFQSDPFLITDVTDPAASLPWPVHVLGWSAEPERRTGQPLVWEVTLGSRVEEG